jgi:hypothetical protein
LLPDEAHLLNGATMIADLPISRKRAGGKTTG